jgi:hypothetical protein
VRLNNNYSYLDLTPSLILHNLNILKIINPINPNIFILIILIIIEVEVHTFLLLFDILHRAQFIDSRPIIRGISPEDDIHHP